MSKKYRELCNRIWGLDFDMLLQQYHMLAVSRWKYENLPEHITSEIIEEYFYRYGKALFVERSADGGVAPQIAIAGTGDYLVLQVVGQTEYNLYNKPQNFTGNGLNYEKYNIPADKCVLMKNNLECMPTEAVVQYYVRKIANIERTLEMNINAQKMPYLFKTKNAKIKLSLNNLLNDLNIGEAAVFLDSEMMSDGDALTILNLNAPYLADKLRTEKQNYINELLTFLGINNLPVEKNERLIQSEVESNNIFINDNIEKEREFREKWVDEVNKMFGLNIKVRFFNEDIKKGMNVDEIYDNIELHDTKSDTNLVN